MSDVVFVPAQSARMIVVVAPTAMETHRQPISS